MIGPQLTCVLAAWSVNLRILPCASCKVLHQTRLIFDRIDVLAIARRSIAPLRTNSLCNLNF